MGKRIWHDDWWGCLTAHLHAFCVAISNFALTWCSANEPFIEYCTMQGGTAALWWHLMSQTWIWNMEGSRKWNESVLLYLHRFPLLVCRFVPCLWMNVREREVQVSINYRDMERDWLCLCGQVTNTVKHTLYRCLTCTCQTYILTWSPLMPFTCFIMS